MNRIEVLNNLIAIANRLDKNGRYGDATELTKIAVKLAQYDDFDQGDFDQERYERPDSDAYEERQLDLDRWHEQNKENGGTYASESEAMKAIRRQQAEYGNEPYVMLIDFDGDDDRNTSYDIAPLSRYEEYGHWMQIYKDIPAGTPEELALYARDLETETPFGVELDGGFDDY